ncbi:hypothetical protein [Pirellula sp. SH-Sr6A]|uniref:hypothetical protein n=1 Tax=Pirellula sp. SH-Sr6A TaxID=1632865 RepID=UPI0011BAC04A|nr:hypothetical protein [Pirellula sp. SH-Sr6A]
MVDINTVADVRLAGRAINDEWPVTPEIRKKVIDRLVYLQEFGEKHSVQVAAAKALQSADQINIKKRAEEQRRLDAEHTRKLQLLDAAVKLGLVKPVGPGIGSMDSQPSGREVG